MAAAASSGFGPEAAAGVRARRTLSTSIESGSKDKESPMPQQENYIHQLIDNLRTKLLTMGTRAQQALDDACQSVLTRDLARATSVMDGDVDIDNLENEIDAASLNILARTQPVARDLRFIMTAVRMVVDLERIGDEAVVVAERVMLAENPVPESICKDLSRFMERSRLMLGNALMAFRDGNAHLALSVRHYDDETAQLMVSIYNRLMEDVRDQHIDPWDSMHIILITRALDRICRRAENIAEHTYFMLEGISLKHNRA